SAFARKQRSYRIRVDSITERSEVSITDSREPQPNGVTEMETSQEAKTYNKRSNAQRAARSALKNPAAADGVDFTTEKNAAGEWVVLMAAGSVATNEESRPMTGFIATLTDEQKAAALAYDGPENHGDAAFITGAGSAPVSAHQPTAHLIAEH